MTFDEVVEMATRAKALRRVAYRRSGRDRNRARLLAVDAEQVLIDEADRLIACARVFGAGA